MKNQLECLRERAEALHLHGVRARWQVAAGMDSLADLVQWEDDGRAQRSLERRVKNTHLGQFKHLSDFDSQWPKLCDCGAVEVLMSLEFMAETLNVVLRGRNGVSRTMLAQNIAHQALVRGHTVLFLSAGQLNESHL
jgi:DNA replication protein DnaC